MDTSSLMVTCQGITEGSSIDWWGLLDGIVLGYEYHNGGQDDIERSKPLLSGDGNIVDSINLWVTGLKYMLFNSDMSYSFQHNIASAVHIMYITLLNNCL